MFKFGERSLKNLQGVHPDLEMLMLQSIKDSPYDFAITEGVRSPERQRELYAQGKSLTLMSRHLTGKAVDIMIYANGKGTWELKYYKEVTDHIKLKAKELDVSIICGIDWRSFVDAVHVELSKSRYL
jgi:peptidoglycan L-alanyl-D-glutamate endopeptidase CwlK